LPAKAPGAAGSANIRLAAGERRQALEFLALSLSLSAPGSAPLNVTPSSDSIAPDQIGSTPAAGGASERDTYKPANGTL